MVGQASCQNDIHDKSAHPGTGRSNLLHMQLLLDQKLEKNFAPIACNCIVHKFFNIQGNFSPPCGRTAGACLLLVTLHTLATTPMEKKRKYC